MSEKQYFVKRSGKIRGPFDTKKIKELVSTQNVLPSDEISTSEKGPWQAVRLVSGLNSKSEFSDNQDTSQSFMKSRYFTIAIGIASLVGTGLVGGLFEYLGGRLAQNAASTADPFQNPQPDVFTEWMNRRDFLKLRAILESEKDGIKFWDLGYWMEAVEGKVMGGGNQFRCKYSDNKAGFDRDQWDWEFELADNRFTDLDTTYKNRGFELYQHDVFEDKEGVTHHQAVWRKNPLYDSFRIDDASELKSLTAWQASKIVKEADGVGINADGLRMGILNLSNLVTIDKDVAQQLAQFQGEKLLLDGLVTIDKDVSRALSMFKGNELELCGLSAISAEVARGLANFKTDRLALGGLKSLNKDVARELAKFKGQRLSILGPAAIDKEATKELTNFKALMSLNGLRTVDADVAKELQNLKGFLLLHYLDGNAINKEVKDELGSNPNLRVKYVRSVGSKSLTKDRLEKTTQTQAEDVKSESEKKPSNQGATNEDKILQRARGAYRYIDSNGDGQITADDILGSPQGKQEKIKDLLERLDKNKNGTVSLNEFSQDPERSFSDAQRFKDLDSDKDGFLSLSEFLRLHRNRAKAQNTEEFKTLDTNADDLLSFEEFGKLGKQ